MRGCPPSPAAPRARRGGGGPPDALASVGFPRRWARLEPQSLPPVPDGTFVVAAEHDQFGTADELRAAYPRLRIAEIKGVDHFFVGKREELGQFVADELERSFDQHRRDPRFA